jgi:hypothetical protein
MIGCSSEDNGTGPITYRPADYLNREFSGWSGGPTESGTTDTEMQNIVNGAFASYTKHGMSEVAKRVWTGSGSQTGAQLDARVHEMTSTAGALGLFTEPDIFPSTGDPEPDLGDSALVALGIGGGVDLWFMRDTYVVSFQVTDSPDVQGALTQLRTFARGIDDQMTQ